MNKLGLIDYSWSLRTSKTTPGWRVSLGPLVWWVMPSESTGHRSNVTNNQGVVTVPSVRHVLRGEQREVLLFCMDTRADGKGGVIDKDEDMVKQRLAFVINAIAGTSEDVELTRLIPVLLFSDSEKAKRDMEAFAAANDNRLYKLFKTCADPLSDLRSLLKAKVRHDAIPGETMLTYRMSF